MSRQPRRTSLGGEERSFNSACGCERNTGRHAFGYFQLFADQTLPAGSICTSVFIWMPAFRDREQSIASYLEPSKY
jgi:hypothetical protein